MPDTSVSIDYPPIVHLDRASVCLRIRQGLKGRSGRDWSVTGGRGTAYGWLQITAPPARRGPMDALADEDRLELERLLDIRGIPSQGQGVPDTTDHYREFIDRAEGRAPRVRGASYWD